MALSNSLLEALREFTSAGATEVGQAELASKHRDKLEAASAKGVAEAEDTAHGIMSELYASFEMPTAKLADMQDQANGSDEVSG